MKEKIFIAAGITFTLVVFVHLCALHAECEARGGMMYRTIFHGYECLKVERAIR